jgi:predicted metallo-beta-lactamase superfamily hydrolase
VKENIEANEEITKFKRLLVSHIENKILNAQKNFEEQIHEELDRFED